MHLEWWIQKGALSEGEFGPCVLAWRLQDNFHVAFLIVRKG
jgi:hypothetical protein